MPAGLSWNQTQYSHSMKMASHLPSICDSYFSDAAGRHRNIAVPMGARVDAPLLLVIWDWTRFVAIIIGLASALLLVTQQTVIFGGMMTRSPIEAPTGPARSDPVKTADAPPEAARDAASTLP